MDAGSYFKRQFKTHFMMLHIASNYVRGAQLVPMLGYCVYILPPQVECTEFLSFCAPEMYQIVEQEFPWFSTSSYKNFCKKIKNNVGITQQVIRYKVVGKFVVIQGGSEIIKGPPGALLDLLPSLTFLGATSSLFCNNSISYQFKISTLQISIFYPPAWLFLFEFFGKTAIV